MDSASSPGDRRFLLSDRVWLQGRYDAEGDQQIAAFVGVSRSTVLRARLSLGIPSRPRGGSERGGMVRSFAVPSSSSRRPSAASQIASRIAEESGPDGPPATLATVAVRVRALSEAKASGDRAALRDALVALGSAAGLVLDHLEKLA